MKNFQYSVDTTKTFDAAVSAIEQKTAEKGFRVLHVHDVAATLAEKGFNREPLKIIEICNARYANAANEALQKDVNVALMLLCPIAVYAKGGQTVISTMKPSSLVEFYPDAGLDDIATQVERAVLQILEEAR